MTKLVLELRAGEVMIINGAPLRFRTRTRIELTAQARFLFGKQVMAPGEADSPARRIYFALQTAYIGDEAEREAGLAAARHFIAEFQEATTSDVVRAALDQALVEAEADRCYVALKLARQIIRYEDAVTRRLHREQGDRLAQPCSTVERTIEQGLGANRDPTPETKSTTPRQNSPQEILAA